MNQRQEILKEMAQEVASLKGGFEDLDVYETIEDLCNELFSENPAEAARSMYFGEISGWNSADGYRLNAYGNLEEVDDIGEEIDGQEEDIVDAWLELHEDSRDSELLERYHNAGGEYGLDGDEEDDDEEE
jgi:hypothetical protein